MSRASTPGGRFTSDFEQKSIFEGIDADLKNPVGTSALWYIYDEVNTAVDPIYDVGDNVANLATHGRIWHGPYTIPIIRAVISQGSSKISQAGFYNADTLHLTLNSKDIEAIAPGVMLNPDAPEGVKGISLFVVPKFLVNSDGLLGERNDVYCVSIEHKLGIKASPTAVLQFGDHGGATGYLVGEENRGLEYMFVMMNAARFAVGMQGVAVAERAYQKAVQYAKDRVQSRDLAGSPAPVAIIHQPDVKRMLMTMRAYTEACRALAYYAAAAYDAQAPQQRHQLKRFGHGNQFSGVTDHVFFIQKTLDDRRPCCWRAQTFFLHGLSELFVLDQLSGPLHGTQ